MTDKVNPSEEYDDGSSIEKNIENLDKDDPLYPAKRETLIEKMKELHKKLEKQHKEIIKQRKELSQILGSLRQQAEKNPQDEKLQTLIAETKHDKAFLTRAVAEIVSLKGNWNNEMGRLSGSKTFNTPLDVKIVTNIELKPLPSSELNKKREQTVEISKIKEKSTPTSKSNKTAAAMARHIFNLRQSTAE